MDAFDEFDRPNTEAMEDLLLTCILLSWRGAGPISLCENHQYHFMKSFRLVEAMKHQLLTCALLSQCGIGPILRVKSLVLSMDDVPKHERVANPLKTRCTRCITWWYP